VPYELIEGVEARRNLGARGLGVFGKELWDGDVAALLELGKGGEKKRMW
jgi:hypothetical protein